MKDRDWLGARNRWIIFVLFLAGIPLVGHGAKKAWDSNTNRVQDWLPESFEETRQLHWFVEQFGSGEILVVSWPGCTVDDERLDRLRTELLAADESGRRLFREVYTGPQMLDRFTEPGQEPPLGLSREEALARLEGWLVGPDHRTSCLLALVSRAGMDDREEAVDRVFQCAAAICDLPCEEIHVAGSTVDSVAINRASEDSLMKLNGLSIAVSLLLIWLCLRSVRVALMVFVTAFSAEMLSLAMLHYTGSHMDSVSLLMTSLVYVLGISAAIHLANYYRDAIRAAGLEGAPGRAVRAAVVPCGLAAATTALGLVSLGISHIVPISKFGVYSAAAVLCGFGLLLLLLPAALTQWPMRQWASPGVTPPARGGAASPWERLAALVTRHHRWIVVLAAVALVAAGLGVAKIRTTISIHGMFADRAKVIRDYDWLENHVGYLVPVEVVLRFPKSERGKLLENLELVEQVRGRIEQIDGVGATISAATFLPDIPSAAFWRQHMRALLTRRHEDLADSHYVRDTDDEQLWRISVRVAAQGNVDYASFLGELREKVDPELKAAAMSGIEGLSAEYCGGVPLVHMAQRQLLRDLFKSFLLAFVLVGLAMSLLLRNVAAGALSMVPNVLPSVLVFGIMGWTGHAVDLGSMMTASVALGIAVDDTLHYVIWFRRAVAQGQTRQEAIRTAYDRCGTAMVQTSLICGLGLLVFVLSPFMPIARFSWLMVILLAGALLGDLVVLPAMLVGPLGRVFAPRSSEPPRLPEPRSPAPRTPEPRP